MSDIASIDAPGKVFPEHVADEARQTIDRVLIDTSFVECDVCSVVLFCKRELLKKTSKSVMTADFGAIVTARRGSANSENLEGENPKSQRGRGVVLDYVLQLTPGPASSIVI